MSGWEFRRISWSGHKVEFGLSENVQVWNNSVFGKKMSSSELQEVMDRLGAEGWEMVNVYGMVGHAPESWRSDGDTHDIHHAWFRRQRK